jgi:hypothetical protein
MMARTLLASIFSCVICPIFSNSFGGADVFLDTLGGQSGASPILQRTHCAQRHFNSLPIIPDQVIVYYLYKFIHAHTRPRVVIEHLILQPSEKNFACRVIWRTTFFDMDRRRFALSMRSIQPGQR